MKVVSPFGDHVVYVKDVQGNGPLVNDVDDNRVVVGEGVLVLDRVVLAFDKGLLGVYGNFRSFIWFEAWEVGRPPVIEWEALLGYTFWVSVGVHCGDSVVPQFLY
jgi:hypothetical protein